MCQEFSFISVHSPRDTAALLQGLSSQNSSLIYGSTVVKILSRNETTFEFTIDSPVPFSRSLSVQVVGSIRSSGNGESIVTGIARISRLTLILLIIFSVFLIVIPIMLQGYLCVFAWLIVLAMSIPSCINERNKLIQALAYAVGQ